MTSSNEYKDSANWNYQKIVLICFAVVSIFCFFCNADVEVKSVEFFCLLRKFLNNPLLFFCVSRGHRSLIFRSNIQIRASLFD